MPYNYYDEKIKLFEATAEEYVFSTSIPKDPNSLALSKWYAKDIDEVITKISDFEKEVGLVCTCSKGCSACCRQVIIISKIELLAMIPTIKNLCEESILSIKEKLASQCKILESHNIRYNTSKLMSNDYLQSKYFKLGMSCPLLNEHNECMVYNVRPTSCWAYRHYGDKHLCNDSFSVPDSYMYKSWEKAVFKRILYTKYRKPPKKKPEIGILQQIFMNHLYLVN